MIVEGYSHIGLYPASAPHHPHQGSSCPSRVEPLHCFESWVWGHQRRTVITNWCFCSDVIIQLKVRRILFLARYRKIFYTLLSPDCPVRSPLIFGGRIQPLEEDDPLWNHGRRRFVFQMPPNAPHKRFGGKGGEASSESVGRVVPDPLTETEFARAPSTTRDYHVVHLSIFHVWLEVSRC